MTVTDATASGAQAPEVSLPVALVVVDTGLPHLDRPFEYAVPQALSDAAQPGVRVKVRFAGQDLPGYVVERRARAEHTGRLAPIRSVVSEEQVLRLAILRLAEELAEAYAATVGDVLRLAIPPRHARAERALSLAAPDGPDFTLPTHPAAWSAYPAGQALLRRLTEGEAPAAAWCAAPGAVGPEEDWPAAIAEAVGLTLLGGRGSLVVVPDHRDVERVDAALVRVLGPGQHVRLTADQGPQARYTAWLRVLRGHVPVAIGTRAAAYAPVDRLGLIVVWDDGDDLHEEPRAPYVHSADVARRRAAIEGAALILGGFGRSVRSQALVEAGAVRSVTVTRAYARDHAPAVTVAGERDTEQERDAGARSARLPTPAWRAAKEALASGPVLIQVPRRGYVPSLACRTCRARARCPNCQGPLKLDAAQAFPSCGWCSRPAPGWVCPVCEGTQVRSLVIGARRTAEELGRAFPGFAVLTSGAGTVLSRVPGRPALVIATPGAEPVADGGYAAALLLDAWALLDRPSLDAQPETLRRWLAAAALVRGRSLGGVVVVCGAPPDGAAPAVDALIRWDPVWLARNELTARAELGLPPVAVFAEATGDRKTLAEIAERTGIASGATAFGPLALPSGDSHRLLLRTTTEAAPGLSGELRAIRAERSARKVAEPLRIRMHVDDPD